MKTQTDKQWMAERYAGRFLIAALALPIPVRLLARLVADADDARVLLIAGDVAFAALLAIAIIGFARRWWQRRKGIARVTSNLTPPKRK